MANVSIRNVFTNTIITFDNDAGYQYTHDGVTGFLVVQNISGTDTVLMIFDDAVDQINDLRKVTPPIDMSHVFSTSIISEDTEDYFDENEAVVDPPQDFRLYYSNWNNPYTAVDLSVALYLIGDGYYVFREFWDNGVLKELVPCGKDFLTAPGIENIVLNITNINIVSPITGNGGLFPPPNFPTASFLALMPGYVEQAGTFYKTTTPVVTPTNMPVGAIRCDAYYPRYYDGSDTENYIQVPWVPAYVNAGVFPYGNRQGGLSNFNDFAWICSTGQSMVNPEYYQYRPFHTIDAPAQNYAFPYYDPATNQRSTIGNTRTSSIIYRGNEQWVMDAELTYAQTAGLDYFLFLMYPDDSPLCYARRLYRSTTDKKGINMAYCTHQMGGDPLGAVGSWWRNVYDKSVEEIGDAMVKSYYQKTVDGRPIVFLDFWGTDSTAISKMQQVKADVQAEYTANGGTAQIYWVLLVISVADTSHWHYVNILGCDSLTWYSQSGDNVDRNYSTAIQLQTMNRINNLYNSGNKGLKDLTPCFTTSFFNKPMWTHSPFDRLRPENGHVYTNVATPQEVTTGLSDVYNYANSHNCKTMIIYAWNEHYEGAVVICPNQNQDGSPNLAYVNAVKAVLNP